MKTKQLSVIFVFLLASIFKTAEKCVCHTLAALLRRLPAERQYMLEKNKSSLCNQCSCVYFKKLFIM